jgi:hypothetical protein
MIGRLGRSRSQSIIGVGMEGIFLERIQQCIDIEAGSKDALVHIITLFYDTRPSLFFLSIPLAILNIHIKYQ